jgi:hypothetical protein
VRTGDVEAATELVPLLERDALGDPVEELLERGAALIVSIPLVLLRLPVLHVQYLPATVSDSLFPSTLTDTIRNKRIKILKKKKR